MFAQETVQGLPTPQVASRTRGTRVGGRLDNQGNLARSQKKLTGKHTAAHPAFPRGHKRVFNYKAGGNTSDEGSGVPLCV